MKVVVLTYVESEEPAPEEVDAVATQVAEALCARGDEATVLTVHGDVGALADRVRAAAPDLIFNLVEMFGDNVLADVSVAGMLELLGVPFTGGGAGELFLAQDKALTKKLLAFEKIAYPRFAVFGEDSGLEVGGNLRMPLFVKPLRMDASIGIDAHGLVYDSRALLERVAFIHRECSDSALAEEFIDGREFYVGVIGNAQARALPPIEMDFSRMPSRLPHVLDRKAKWELESPEYQGTNAIVADLSTELRAKLCRTALEAYRALHVRDYGRVDLRMTDAGDIHVLEVNANCYLERSGEFVMAAEAAGITYGALIQSIADGALARFRKERESLLPRQRRSKLPA